MRVFKWLFLAVVWSLVAAFFHYQLPRTDIVRVVGTDVQRFDVGERPWFWSQATSTGTFAGDTREVPIIQTIRPNGREIVYRNEDTGWGWPPYFKFDSQNVQARAADLISDRESPQWVAVRRYGWRLPVFTVFPNALSIDPVSGPDAIVIPWVAIGVLIAFLAAFWAIYVRWRRFRIARIDPRLDHFDAAWDERRAQWTERRRARRGTRTRG